MSTETDPARPPTKRVRQVVGSHNLRDLGGVVTEHGSRVRTGRVFRCDYPAFADADAAAWDELRLATVVDLRRGTEVAVECVDWSAHGVRWCRWPLSAGRESSWRAGYAAYLESRPGSVVGAVRAVMDPRGHAVLFHCAAGKDRTGVVATLLLSVLGVAEQDIVAEHLLSGPSVEPVLTRLRRHALYAEMLAGSSLEDQAPAPRQVESLLEWLRVRGGAEAWLVDQGLRAEEVEAFRATMLEVR